MESLIDNAYDAVGNCIAYIYSYGPLADKTVVFMSPFVQDQVAKLSTLIKFDEATLCYTLGMFLCYPLGIIMHMLPYGKMKHIFSFLMGAALLQFSLKKQWIHHMITVLVSYLILLVAPAKRSKVIIPVFVMTYLTLGHMHRQFVNYLGWDLGFHTTHMILTIKLYSLSYNLYDGEMLAKGKADRASQKCSNLSLNEIPSFIEFLGYTFNFSTILAGPAFEYKIYKTACDGSNLYDENGKPKGNIPSNIGPTIKPFLTGLCCMALFVFGSKKFPIHDPRDPQNFSPIIFNSDFLSQPLIYRYFYFWMGLIFVRQKYYFAWKNAEGACNIWYAGFEGFKDDGTVKGWEHSVNVDILKFELAPSFKVGSAAWNKKTATWLSRYVYFRTGSNLVLTYIMSSFWHGFYPGYYMFFLSIPLLTACERLSTKKISPYFSPNDYSPYGILAIVSTTIVLNYFTQAFQLLSFEWATMNWKNEYFFGHIVLIIYYLAVSKLPNPKKKEA